MLLYRLVALPLVFFVAVLFGANPIDQFWGTLLWALLISTLVFLPGHLLLGDDSHLFSVVVLQHSMMMLLGAWLGAFPILLDWNRPWQVWPVPSCIGAIVGCSVGYVGYGVLQYWQHWNRKHSPV